MGGYTISHLYIYRRDLAWGTLFYRYRWDLVQLGDPKGNATFTKSSVMFCSTVVMFTKSSVTFCSTVVTFAKSSVMFCSTVVMLKKSSVMFCSNVDKEQCEVLWYSGTSEGYKKVLSFSTLGDLKA